jgi:hypothetical protein
MPTLNHFSVKCEVYTSAKTRRVKCVNGPWKPTVEAALAESLKTASQRRTAADVLQPVGPPHRYPV